MPEARINCESIVSSFTRKFCVKIECCSGVKRLFSCGQELLCWEDSILWQIPGVLVKTQCLLGICLAGVMRLIFLMASKAISPSFIERSWGSAFWKSGCSLGSTFSLPLPPVNTSSLHFLWKACFCFLGSGDGERCGWLASEQLCFANWM